MLLVNVIKKLQKEGFVRFDGVNLLDGEGNIIDSIEDVDGVTNSAGQKLYIAYASNTLGADFTLTASTTLEYIAAKASTTVPGVNDFNGLWFHRKGLPGQATKGDPGVDGFSAGFDCVYSSTVTEGKPGAGKIRFNTTTLSAAVWIYLDEDTPAGTDLSGVISLLTIGTHFVLRKKGDSDTMAVFKLTAAPVEQGSELDWFKIAVVSTALSATTFVDGDECTFQFFGGSASGSGTVTENAVLAAGNFLRAASNGSGGYNILDNTGSVLKSANHVYKLPAFSISGVLDLPQANTFPHGSVVRLHENCFVGVGANPFGAMLQADANANKWRPFGRQMLFFKTFGSYASPTCTLTASGNFTIGTAPIIPAGLLLDDSRLVFFVKYQRVDNLNAALVMNVWFGHNATKGSNSKVYTNTMTQTDNQEVIGRAELDFLSATTARSSSKTSVGGSGNVNTTPDMTASLDIAQNMSPWFDTSGHTTAGDTVMLYEIGIAWER